MPYHMRKSGSQWCVYKGTKDNPGEKMKCYSGSDAKSKARDYLGALYANVEDAGTSKEMYIGEEEYTSAQYPTVGSLLESSIHQSFTRVADALYAMGYISKEERIVLSSGIGSVLDTLSQTYMSEDVSGKAVDWSIAERLCPGAGYGRINTYKEIDGDSVSDRWIAVSSHADWDRQGELMTTEAMDWDISRAYRYKSFPELRLWHVRGFKLGMCDHMERIGSHPVDYGYWFDTPLAQCFKDMLAHNDGTWRVSRGFYAVKATGLCPKCDTGLDVGLLNYITGIRCKDCGLYIRDMGDLDRLTYYKTSTYDISVTDVPVVTKTAVLSYSVKN